MGDGTVPWFSKIHVKYGDILKHIWPTKPVRIGRLGFGGNKENRPEIHGALAWEENETSKSPISGKRLVLSNNGSNIVPTWDSQITKTSDEETSEEIVGDGTPVFDKPWCRYETPYTYNVNISEDLSNTEFVFQKFFP